MAFSSGKMLAWTHECRRSIKVYPFSSSVEPLHHPNDAFAEVARIYRILLSSALSGLVQGVVPLSFSLRHLLYTRNTYILKYKSYRFLFVAHHYMMHHSSFLYHYVTLMPLIP